jgi:hypothetical protein
MYSIPALLADSQWPAFLDRPATVVFAVPIAAILVGGILAITRMLIRHRERMAMIEQGMHPDHPFEPCDREGHSDQRSA